MHRCDNPACPVCAAAASLARLLASRVKPARPHVHVSGERYELTPAGRAALEDSATLELEP